MISTKRAAPNQVAPKSLVLAAALAACLHAAPAAASSPVVFISSTGSDSNQAAGCTAAAPCATFDDALLDLNNGGQVSCLHTPDIVSAGNGSVLPVATIDCLGTFSPTSGSGFTLPVVPMARKIRHLTINGAGGATSAIIMQGGGSLEIEDCVFENFAGNTALLIEPTGPLHLVIRNTRISNGGGGIFIKPGSGGSVTAILDNVTIAQNSGGAIRADSSNGPITVDVTDSTISDNGGNGFNVTSGTGGLHNVMTITRTTIANNGVTGIQAGGSNASVVVDTTMLDSNASGATFAGGGGSILSAGNNRIVGAAGSGFTGAATLQ